MTSISRALGIVTICTTACTLAFVVPAKAQQAAIAYEQGVNAYFAGNSYQADTYLSSAIQWNSQDPRAYYFRALTLLRQGRCDLARGDMQVGAMLEAAQPNRYSVGSALERVQGSDRLMLEEFRRNARLTVAASTPSATAGAPVPNRTYRENEGEVLRDKSFVPLDELLRPEGPRAIAVEPPAEPAAKAPPVVPPQPGAPALAPDKQPATPPAAAEKDPFADDSASAAPKATPAPTPAPTPPVPPQEVPKKPATPPAEEDANPFGG